MHSVRDISPLKKAGFSAFHQWNALVGLPLLRDHRELETWLFPNKYVIVENASSPLSTMADPGGGAGGPPPPPPHPIFRPNWDLGPRGRKIFLDTAPPPLSQGLDDWGFPLSQGLDDWGFPLSQGPDDRAPSYFRLNDRPPPYLRLNDRVPPLSEGLDSPLVKVLYSRVNRLQRAW